MNQSSTAKNCTYILKQYLPKMNKYPCGVCTIGCKYSSIRCKNCKIWFHAKCVNITSSDYKKIAKDKVHSWQCQTCSLLSNDSTMICQNIEPGLNTTNIIEEETNQIINISMPEEVFSNERVEDSECNFSLKELSETFNQLQYERKMAEVSLGQVIEEAEDTIASLRTKIESLEKENVLLKDEIKNKDNKILRLTQSIEVNSQHMATQCDLGKKANNNDLINFLEKNSKNKVSTALLEQKIKDLEHEKNTMMENIIPYPQPIQQLHKELDLMDEKFKKLEENYHQEITSKNLIIEILTAEINENSLLNKNINEIAENDQLHTDNRILHVNKPGCKNKFTEVIDKRNKTIHKTPNQSRLENQFFHPNRYQCLSEMNVNEYELTFDSGILKEQQQQTIHRGDSTFKSIEVHSNNIKNVKAANKCINQKEKCTVKQPILILSDSMLKHVNIPDANIKVYRGIQAKQLCSQIKLNAAISPELVCINVGTNDLANTRSPDDVMGAMYNVLATTKKCFPKSLIVINSLVQRRNIKYTLTKKTNFNIRWLCRQMQAIFLDTSKHFDVRCLARDGIHPNRRGISVLQKAIINVYSLFKKQELMPTGNGLLHDQTKDDHTTTTANKVRKIHLNNQPNSTAEDNNPEISSSGTEISTGPSSPANCRVQHILRVGAIGQSPEIIIHHPEVTASRSATEMSRGSSGTSKLSVPISLPEQIILPMSTPHSKLCKTKQNNDITYTYPNQNFLGKISECPTKN